MRNLPLGIALLAACGSDNAHRLADAAIDGARVIDAAPDAIPLGTVALEILANGVPARDVEVYFLDADSTVVATVFTDANGIAEATMHSGGSVTAVDPFGNFGTHDLETFAQVKVGDHLRLVSQPQQVATTLTVTAPVDPGSLHTLLFTSCGQADLTQGAGSGTGPVSVTLSGCPSTIDMLVESTDVNFVPLKSVFQPAVTVFDGAQITLTNTTYQPVTVTAFDLTNMPAASTFAGVQLGLESARGPVLQTSASVTLSTGSGLATVGVPAFANAQALVQMRLGTESFAERGLIAWGPFAASDTFDGSKLLAAYTGNPQFDIPTASASIALDTTGVTPDIAVVSEFFQRPVGPTTVFWTWHVAAPFAAAIPFPHLPTDVFDFNAQATDTVGADQFLSIQFPGGYDAVRENILTPVSPDSLTTATSGTAAFEVVPSR
jgi:hypothetical protein